ncbi:MAG: transglycosylase domain-containing protein [Cardiobacteriaceae bacterium]|nr:transglycosylase domain-containing protein [Cardiobacteriaceae bacterium]
MLRIFRNVFYLVCGLGFLLLVATYMYGRKLEHDYQLSDSTLTGALWEMPAKVYARPLELYVGKALSVEDLEFELKLLGFDKVSDPIIPKTYSRQKQQIIYYAESFDFGGGENSPARRMEINFSEGKISEIINLTDFNQPSFERLNPLQIATIYPKHLQDRLLVKLDEVPPLLIDTLINLEDKRFWTHIGFDLKGIARAFYISFISKSGSQQGASTLTQQFVKNHYLTNERTVTRKIKEILMAIILEAHNDKAHILEGYLNEIYLGQDGKHAIHGFGLASLYYFDKKLSELNLHEIALLVALVREPGNADPHRNPDYALSRRNFILEQMANNALISEELANLAKTLPLDVLPKGATSKRTLYPAFMDLVQQQLNQHYSREDLTNEGLNIFTTLNPTIQHKMQQELNNEIKGLEGRRTGFLQGAAVLVDITSGDVVSVIGGRDAEKEEIHGFNRALSAQRQAGSVIKPFIYLSALAHPTLRYTTASRLNNSPLNYQGWKPKNAYKSAPAEVNFRDSLIKSYNIPTARIAIDLGMETIIRDLESVGARKGLPPYPSLSLGAIGMTPFEIAQIYETLANKGEFTPLRSILKITTPSGETLPPHDQERHQAIDTGLHYLVTTIMQDIPKHGTAKNMSKGMKKFNPAGKTGTTDNNRDAWFAGFTGNFLNVVWVGNDENQPTGLSGGNSALRVWDAMMLKLPQEPLELEVPANIEFFNIDLSSGLLAGQYCSGIRLPFLIGTEPFQVKTCEPPEEVYEEFYFLNSTSPTRQEGSFNARPTEGTQTPILQSIQIGN